MSLPMNTTCTGCGRNVKDYKKLDKKGMCEKCQKKEAL